MEKQTVLVINPYSFNAIQITTLFLVLLTDACIYAMKSYHSNTIPPKTNLQKQYSYTKHHNIAHLFLCKDIKILE